jgi:hypothetical protein
MAFTALVVACQLSGCALFVAGAVAGGAVGAGVDAGVAAATRRGPQSSAAGDSTSALVGTSVTIAFAVARDLDAVRASKKVGENTPEPAPKSASDVIHLSSVVWLTGRVTTVRNDSLAVVLTEAFGGVGRRSFSGSHEVVVARDARMSIRFRDVPGRWSRGRSIAAGALLGIVGVGVWLAVALAQMET